MNIHARWQAILLHPMAWSRLERQDKDEILALFPSQQHIVQGGDEDGGGRPDFGSLLSDDSFRNDCAAYSEDLATGRHDPEWLADAWMAHERRKAGDFDDYLKAKFELEWNVDVAAGEKPGEEREVEEMKDAKTTRRTTKRKVMMMAKK